jgi:bifunctional non-homologous end joining protein LigD
VAENQNRPEGKIPGHRLCQRPHGRCRAVFREEGRQSKELVYMGKVGTGWSRTVSSQIRKQLDTVVSPKSKLTKPIKKPKATWVEPSFVADIEYRDITSEGLLRASSFKGLSRK